MAVRYIVFFGCLLVLAACAATLQLDAVTLNPADTRAAPLTLTTDTFGRPVTGDASVLPSGTRLQPIGRIPQGTVFRPVGRELIVYGQEREEADIVLQEKTWTGYYLPFEKAFLKLKQPIQLPTE